MIRNVMLVIQPNGNGSHAIYPQEYGKYRRSVSHRKSKLKDFGTIVSDFN